MLRNLRGFCFCVFRLQDLTMARLDLVNMGSVLRNKEQKETRRTRLLCCQVLRELFYGTYTTYALAIDSAELAHLF
jgi:hypothetical protein